MEPVAIASSKLGGENMGAGVDPAADLTSCISGLKKVAAANRNKGKNL